MRNWDYRFAWPRDASIGVGAFLGVGKDDEARGFLAWLLHASRLDAPGCRCCSRCTAGTPRRTRARGWPGYADSRRSGSATAPPTSTNSTATAGCSTPPGCSSAAGHRAVLRDLAGDGGFADLVARTLARARRRHLGDPRRRRPPRALQAHGLARPRPGPAHRRHTSDPRPGDAADGSAQRDAIAEDVPTRGFDPALGSYTRSYGSTTSTRRCSSCRCSASSRQTPPASRGTIDAIAPRARRRRPPPLPLSAGTRRPPRHRRRVPALLVLARAGARPDRTRRRGRASSSTSCSHSRARSASTPRRWTPRPVATSATTRRR